MHEKDASCTHQITTLNDHGMVACGHCQTVEWFTPAGRADAHAGMGAAFGNFDQVATLSGLGQCAPHVTLYLPASKADERALKALPVRVWLEVHPSFWISSDATHLLISADPLGQLVLADHPPTLTLVPTPA